MTAGTIVIVMSNLLVTDITMIVIIRLWVGGQRLAQWVSDLTHNGHGMHYGSIQEPVSIVPMLVCRVLRPSMISMCEQV